MGRLHVSQNGSAPVVTMVGEFDIATASDLRDLLAGLGPRVVLDLAETTFIDSTTLNTLVAARNHGTKITIINDSAAVRRVLEITSLEKLFGVGEDEETTTPR